jgi:hypothetical protein
LILIILITAFKLLRCEGLADCEISALSTEPVEEAKGLCSCILNYIAVVHSYMRKVYLVVLILAVSVGILFVACKQSYKASQHGEAKSHKQGTLCMSCHTPGGSAKDVYLAAGTVYDEVRLKPQGKAVIKFYTEPKAQGKLVATLKADELGNFYTTEKLDFSQGLYPTLIGTPEAKENIKHMNRKVFRADCNWCHGIGEESLGID